MKYHAKTTDSKRKRQFLEILALNLKIYTRYIRSIYAIFLSSLFLIKYDREKDRRKEMGYALFTARKMSLQAKVNQYNLQLMKISDKENQLTQKTAALQQRNNKIDAAQNKGSMFAKIGGTLVGAAFGGIGGAMVGSELGGGFGKVANAAVDKGQQAYTEYQQNELSRQQTELDTEKQRINTLLTKAQYELQQVEQSEESAIKSATPKYVA